MLSPLAPHMAAELSEMLGQTGTPDREWPAFDPELAREDEYEIVVQINGRVRGHVVAEAGVADEELVRRALADPKTASFLEGKQIVKTVVVPNKLVNIVVR
jgi:leucyl-tRNA synthetase